MVRNSRLVAATLAAFFAMTAWRSGAAADVPALLGQQGRLLDANDVPVTGTVQMVFSLYTSPTGGTAQWTETLNVQLDDGYFAETLGTVTAIDPAIFDGSPLYLGITVEADPEMTPREELVSVPYAIVATDVTGDINPASVSIGGNIVIDSDGNWVGSPTGLVGPTGPAGADGAIGPMGPAGADGADGAIGPMGPVGADGADGADGATGPIGPIGPIGPLGPAGADGADGATGPIGPIGPAGADGADGATGPIGPTGPAGTYSPPTKTAAIFGSGPITHYNEGDWILEATSSTTLQLRNLTGTGFLNWNFIYPSGCGAGTSGVSQSFRFSTTIGQTLTGTLCSEGSTLLVTVNDGSSPMTLFRCHRRTANHNECQRFW